MWLYESYRYTNMVLDMQRATNYVSDTPPGAIAWQSKL